MSATLPLRQRILRAGTWTLGGNLASQVMRLASNLVMTRLLVPEMFGVMALANVIMAGMQLLSDLGLRQNIVQSRRGNEPVFLNTTWTVQILRGGLLWLLMLVVAGALHFSNVYGWWSEGSVYAVPILPWVIAVLSFNALISGFESTKLATASRNLALGHVTLIDLSCNLAGIAFMMSWALIDHSIWALVFGTLITSMLRTLASHAFLPGVNNQLQWDRQAIREILLFGKWVFVSSILGFLSANGDRLLLGALVGPAILGVYSIAFMMVGALRDAFMQLGGGVAFPAFSEVVRERRGELKRVYYKFRLPLDVVTLLFTGILFSAGHLLVQFLYDARYHAAGNMVEVLSLILFEVRYALAAQCFLALGMPKLLTPIILIRLVALFGFMPIAFAEWGVAGALWTVSGSILLTLPITIYFKIQNGFFDLKRELYVLPLLVVGYVFGSLLEQLVKLLDGVP